MTSRQPLQTQQEAALRTVMLNGQAVNKIKDGDFLGALSSLMRALAIAKNAVDEDRCKIPHRERKWRRSSAARVHETHRHKTQDETKPESVFFWRQEDEESAQKQENEHMLKEQEENGTGYSVDDLSCSSSTTHHFNLDRSVGPGRQDYFLCQQPLQVVDAGLAVKDPLEAFKALSYCVVYNIALCQHLRGIDTSREPKEARQDYLRRVVELYKQVRGLLGNVKCSPEERILHAMVITNNMGHAYGMLENHDASSRCFHQVWHIVIKTSTARQESSRKWDAIMNDLMSNILRLIGSHTKAPSAPAA